MKRVIEGKTYNTESATELVTASSGLSRSDFHHWRETLYRTKSGAYFLSGQGGAMSSWRERCGDMWGRGSGIRVLTEQEAREWVERHANEKYESIFGPAPEA